LTPNPPHSDKAGDFTNHNPSQPIAVNNRILKAFAPLVLASMLLQTPAAYALTGGPFDGGRSPGASAAGTYSAVITGRNLTGLTQFGVSDSSESNGRFAVFHEGIMSYGVTNAIADAASQRIAGMFLGVALLPNGEGNANTGAEAQDGNSTQALRVRGSAEGAFTAEMKGFPVAITFEGEGQISTVANPVTVTDPVIGPDITVTGAGTADGQGGSDPQIVEVTTPANVSSTTLRATTPFEIRGSRTSLTGYTSINSFTAVEPLVPTVP